MRHRDFAVFWSAALLSNIGTWMQMITVPFALDHLTDSTAVVGVGAFFGFFPIVLATPIAGSLADRYSRRTVLFCSQSVMMVCAFAMFALWASGAATPVNLIVCVTVSAFFNGITQPSWQSFITQLVPREELLNAVRLNSLQFTCARAIGPGIGGLILATLGPSAAFFGNGLSYVIVLGALFVIPARPVGDATPTRMMAHFWEGVRYMRARRVLRVSVITIGCFALFGQSIIQLAEPFTRRVLHVGPGAYGFLIAGYGTGAILGSFTTVYAHAARRSTMTMIGIALFLSAQIAFALSPSYAVAMATIVVLGLSQVIWQVTVQTAVQANVDETHRGRALALYVSAFWAGAPIGALIGGVVGGIVGLRATFLGFGLLLAAFLAVANFRFERFRLFDQTYERTEELVLAEHTRAAAHTSPAAPALPASGSAR